MTRFAWNHPKAGIRVGHNINPPMLRACLLSLYLASGAFALAQKAPAPGEVLVVAAFHCLGIYWSPAGGEAGKQVTVQYRVHGESAWKEGLPMRYNPIAATEEDLADYRGSIVHLTPGTMYDVQLALAGTSLRTNLSAKTWSEKFPQGEVVQVTNRNTPLVIKNSGTSSAWRVYDGSGATIDVQHQHDSCITVNASHVILRGFTLKGAGATNLDSKRIIGAVRIAGGHDIVIENCDISGWGRLNPETGFGFKYDAAIFSNSTELM